MPVSKFETRLVQCIFRVLWQHVFSKEKIEVYLFYLPLLIVTFIYNLTRIIGFFRINSIHSSSQDYGIT